MKVFFTASQRGKDNYLNHLKKIQEELKNLGMNLVEDDLFKVSKQDFFQKINDADRQVYVEFYKSKMRSIQAADLCVFECSIHSLSMGFLVQKALDFNKPTIVLYSDDNVPHFLAGTDDEKLILRGYNDKNLKKILKEVTDIAKERRDKRFNFFLSPKLLEYLEDASKKAGVTKSKLIRDLIVDHMRKEQSSTYGD